MSNTWIVDIGFYRDSTFVQINRYARVLLHARCEKKKKNTVRKSRLTSKVASFFFLSEKIETGSVEKKKRKKGEDRNRTYSVSIG